MPTKDEMTAALERAEIAGHAAQKAIDARDAKQAPPLIYEVLTHTLDALALCARAGELNALQNLAPNVTYYVRVLTALAADPFDAVQRIGLGSSIGVGE